MAMKRGPVPAEVLAAADDASAGIAFRVTKARDAVKSGSIRLTNRQ
jgi:hypothetical protein